MAKFPPDPIGAPSPTAKTKFKQENNAAGSTDGDGSANMSRGGPGRLIPSAGTSGPQAHQGPPAARGHDMAGKASSGPAHNGQSHATPSSRGHGTHPQGGVMAAMEAQANKIHPVGG